MAQESPLTIAPLRSVPVTIPLDPTSVRVCVPDTEGETITMDEYVRRVIRGEMANVTLTPSRLTRAEGYYVGPKPR